MQETKIKNLVITNLKTGKTTQASKFPKSLILGFEMGYLALPDVMALPITRWSDFKQVLKQLKTDEAHEMYDNIVVDVVDIAYDLCEKYICSKNGVDTIGDIGYGGGYAQTKKEFDECIRQIPQMGYGLVLISHAQDKTFTDEDGKEYNQITPTLGNQGRLVVDRMADIIGYARPVETEEGTKTYLFMRGTPRFIAGSRFKYTPEVIEFTYDNLVKAIDDAITKQAEETGNDSVTSEKDDARTEKPNYDFNALMGEFNEIVNKLQEIGGGSFGTKYAPTIAKIVEKYLGKGKKISNATEQQAEQVALIVSDLEEFVGNGI